MAATLPRRRDAREPHRPGRGRARRDASRTDVCGATPAGTAARSRRAARACAACAFARTGRPQGPLGLRRRAPVRSDREEAVLPRPARLRRALLRHARLRSALRVLPELVHLAVGPRPRGRRAPRATSRAAELAELAVESGAPTVVSTYNEPLITSEWAVEVFAEARRRGLRTAYVSNGNGTPQVLDYIRPWVDFYKVDLKSMDDKHYRQLGGVLENVLDTIAGSTSAGIWLEILTLVDPGLQRLGGGADARGPFHRLRVDGHPLARDGVPPRLQDDRPRARRRSRPSCGRARSGRPRACATSTRATSRAGSGSGRTRAARSARRP